MKILRTGFFASIFFALFCQQISAAVNFSVDELQPADKFRKPFSRCWEIKNNSIESFASDNELLVVKDNDGNISSIDKKNNLELWKINLGSKNDPAIKLFQNRIFILTNEIDENEDRFLTVRELDRQSGITKNINKYNASTEFKILANSDAETVLLLRAKEISLISLPNNRKEFDIKNIKDVSSDKVKLYVRSEGHFFISANDKIYVYKSSGVDDSEPQIINSKIINSKSSEISAMELVENSPTWGDTSGKVFQFETKSASIKRILRAGGKISFIKQLGAETLIASDDNFIYLISNKDRKTLWKKRLPGRITLMPTGRDDIIILSTIAENEIYFLDKNNGKLVNEVNVKESKFIKDFRLTGSSLFILTDVGLLKYDENCPAD